MATTSCGCSSVHLLDAPQLNLFLCLLPPLDHNIDFVAMDVAVNAAAGALKAFFADLPSPLIPYSLHPELVEAASKNQRRQRCCRFRGTVSPADGSRVRI